MATCLAVCAECGEECGEEATTHLGNAEYCPDCAATRVVCSNCGEVVEDSVTDSGGNVYCDDCYHELYTTCHHCGSEVASDETAEHDGNDYCEDCYSEQFTTCEACGDKLRRENARSNDDGDDFCEDCYCDRYTSCERCNCEVYRDDAVYYNEAWYCESCAPDGWEPDDFHPSESFGRVGSRRRFGVELETSACVDYQELEGRTCFGCKEDGSITGKEFVSPILSSDRGLEAIEEFCELASDFAVDEKCGFHLHIDATRLTTAQLKRIALAYRLTETIWHSFVPEGRRDNHYCKPIAWYAHELDQVDDFRQFVNQYDRYYWLNLAALRQHNTIEIRLHSSTLDPNKVANWVKAHLRFVDWAVHASEKRIRATLTGGITDVFAAIARIWKDENLADFYATRAEKFGKTLRRERVAA